MIDAILSLLTGGNSIFVWLGAAFLAVFGAWSRGRTTGARAERDKQAADRLEAMTEAQRVDEAVAGRDAATNRERMRRWGGE